MPVHGFPGLIGGWLLGLLFSLIGAVLFAVGAKLASMLGDRLPLIGVRPAGERDADL